jgi:hypothetical protein
MREHSMDHADIDVATATAMRRVDDNSILRDLCV